jgi:Intracellular proteinase inhibitor
MNFRVTVWVAAIFALVGCSPSSGVYRWVPFMPQPKKAQSPTAPEKVDKSNPLGPITGPIYYGMEMRVKVNPDVIRLSDTRTLEVHLQLINRSKKPINLLFNDSRKYDFILRDTNGKKLAQWSDDQPVNQTPGYVIINPGERAEFVGNVSTRDMVAGRTYSLEAVVIGYDKMRQVIQLTPSGERAIPSPQRPIRPPQPPVRQQQAAPLALPSPTND